jgi:hypothetical protein
MLAARVTGMAPRQIAEKPICGIFICRKNRLNFAEILFAEIFICRNFHLPKYFRGIFACRTIIYFRHLFENLVALILGLLFPQLKICMYVFIFDKNRSR